MDNSYLITGLLARSLICARFWKGSFTQLFDNLDSQDRPKPVRYIQQKTALLRTCGDMMCLLCTVRSSWRWPSSMASIVRVTVSKISVSIMLIATFILPIGRRKQDILCKPTVKCPVFSPVQLNTIWTSKESKFLQLTHNFRLFVQMLYFIYIATRQWRRWSTD